MDIEAEVTYREFPITELKSIDGTAYLKIYVCGFQYQEDTEDYDADWYKIYLDIACHGFTVKMEEPMLSGLEFERWDRDTDVFFQSKEKSVDYFATEPTFSFSLEHDESSKSYLVKGQVSNSRHEIYRCNLKFEFFVDVDSIQRFSKGLKEILRVFPSRNKSWTPYREE